MLVARRTILLTLSLLVLMSSVGFSVGLHLCGGALQDMALFHNAEACPLEQKQEQLPCHKEENSASDDAAEKSCCQDNLIVMDGVDDAVASKATVSFQNPDLHLLAILQTAFLFLLPQDDAPKASYASYLPPPLVRDIPVLVQSFLI